MQIKQFLSVGLLVGGMALPAVGQPQQPDEVKPAATTEFEPHWTDGDIGRAAEMIIGTWKTAEDVNEWGPQAEGASPLVLQVAAVPVEGVENALYAEASRADQMSQPFRQTIMSLYRYKGQIRLRTYEFRKSDQEMGVYVGTWAAPDYFPPTTKDDLIATLDVALTASNNGFSGKTPYPYPTGLGDAVEMTSEVQLMDGKMTTADRGYDANGKVVWGSQEGQSWTWNKIDNPAKVMHMDKGVIAIDYTHPEGKKAEAGDRIFVHYSGWTGDGFRFDSSRPRNSPFELVFPSPGRLIEGWNIGLDGMTVGTKRRLIVPSDVGYGERGQPRANIPPNATLYFEVELMAVQTPEDAQQPQSSDEDQPD